MPCTALIKYAPRWAVEDPVLDLIILWHDQAVYEAMMASYDDDNEGEQSDEDRHRLGPSIDETRGLGTLG